MLRKSNYRRFLALGLAVVLTATSVCVPDTSAEAAKAKKVKSITLKIGKKKVTKKTYKITKGTKATIKVTVKPAKAKKSVTFKTSNKKVATVTKKGVVKAKKKGTAKITVTVKGKDNKKKKTWVKIKVVNKKAAVDPTEEPAATDVPSATEAPAATEAPTATDVPATEAPATATPTVEPTATPEPTPLPTVGPTVEPKFNYTTETNPLGFIDENGTPLYGGDPSILVDGDTVYLYVGHDTSTTDAYQIPEYCVYSTKDLKTWNYHGVVLSMKDVAWADNNAAWAGQVMKHNNRYYLYFCSWDSTDSGKQSIGVAVADNPTGPFEEIGKPLVKGSVTTGQTSDWNDIDPTAWIETDEEGVEHRYLSWGNGKVFMCELNDDMISVKDINGDGKITFGTQASGKTSKNVDIIEKNVSSLTFTEAPWIYRRQDADGNYYGQYYLFYAWGWREEMAYATTDDLMNGTLTYGGKLMPPSVTSNTNHSAVFDFNGKTYFVYHTGALPGGSGFRRTPCIAELHFNEDGSIQPVPESASGLFGTVSTLYSSTGDTISHENFTNSSADADYPYTKIGVGVYEGALTEDSEWVISKGKVTPDETSEYVSIQAENKLGLYLTANEDKTVTLAQAWEWDAEAMAAAAKTQTFKVLEGLADANGVSYESVSQPGYYLTILAGKMYLTKGTNTAAATFYVNEAPENTGSEGTLSSDNELTGLSIDGYEVTQDGTNYTLTVPYTVNSLDATLTVKDLKGFAVANGALADLETGDIVLNLTGIETTFDIVVYAEDMVTTKTYTLTVTKDFTNFEFTGDIVKIFDFEEATDDAFAVTKATVPVAKTDATYSYSEGVNDGKAIALDGTYGLELCDAAALGESYTLSFWMKPSKLNGAVDPTIAAGIFSPEHWLNLTFDAKIWSKGPSTAWIATTAANAYKAGEWQHVAVVVDSSMAGSADGFVIGKLYINGKLVSEGDVVEGIMTETDAKVYFGVNAWDAYFQGDLDEIMLINGAIPASEIEAIAANIVTAKSIQE